MRKAKYMRSITHKQSGAVSLFVVVFSALLITVITVGFVGIMIRNQRQASDNDLSQSAYDSAVAGVEDGKRAILRYVNCTNTPTSDCGSVVANMAAQTCTNIVGDLMGVNVDSDGEVKLQGSSNTLNQAYTCVKIELNTPNYLGTLEKDGSKLIPLVGESAYDRIRIDWFMQKDLATGNSAKIPTFSLSGQKLMLTNSNWTATNNNIPSIMRAQLIQYDSDGVVLSSFDNNTATGSNANTLFLYPTGIVSSILSFSSDTRRGSLASPLKQIYCESDLDLAVAPGYACSATIILPSPIDTPPISTGNRQAYLNLTSLYSKANYQVTLLDSAGNTVRFAGVQPEIDSTGRANDLFRRVKSRVEMTNNSNLVPEAAVDVEEKLCKDYIFYTNAALTNGCV